jgi:hypothetical protein
MKHITLDRLEISNFKGISQLEIDFSHRRTSIYGDNATGKTTVYDAFIWLLFDKDSSNSATFNIKPLSVAGAVAQRGVEPVVTAVIDIDGKPTELRKVYKEKWKKKRGSADQEFDGHETDYYIDGVPKKKGEYVSFIQGVVPEALFRQLTDVRYFNGSTTMKWTDRRALLLEMCGDIADADVIYNNEQLHPLTAHLAQRTMDDYKKILAARRRNINEERETLPVRIDEAYRSVVPDLDEDADRAEIDRIESRIAFLQAEKNISENADVLADALRKADAAIYDLNSKNDHYKNEQLAKNDQEYLIAYKQHSALTAKLDETKVQARAAETRIALLQSELAGMRKEYLEIDARQWQGDRICPTCGQELPADQVDAGIEKFNLAKAEALIANNRRGTEKKAELDKLTAELADMQELCNRIAETIPDVPEKASFTPADLPDYAVKLDDLQTKKNKLRMQRNEELAADTANRNDREIAELTGQLDAHKANLLRAENNRTVRERIAALEAQEKALAKQYEETERQVFLTEEFTKEKVRMLEEKINNTFKLARFKLFSDHVNGGMSECCEVTYKGVPYADLNNAMKINMGIDVINALSAHYGIAAPLVIDNAESVTDLLDAPGQLIRLVVSEGDAKLRVENAEGVSMAFPGRKLSGPEVAPPRRRPNEKKGA